MKKLVATAPRVAELKEYQDREIKSNEVLRKLIRLAWFPCENALGNFPEF